jgi:adenylate cyclase
MAIAPIDTRAGVWATLLTLVCATVLQVVDPLPAQIMRNATFDQFQRLKPRRYQASPVKIIDIDDASLNKLGQWPWPRTRIAELIGLLKKAKPQAIAFDILFTEADRTSPQALLKLWPISGSLRQTLARLPDHDRVLAEAFKGSGVVLGFASAVPGHADTNPLPIRARFIELGNPHTAERLPTIDGILPPLPPLAAAAAGNGALNFVADADGVIRKIPLLLNHRGRPVPTLAAETLRIAQRTPNITLVAESENSGDISAIRIGKIVLPTTARAEIWLHYTPPERTRALPAWKILAGEVPPADLQNTILLVGTSAQGLMDLRFSPLGQIVPGIDVHAQALEQMLNGQYLLRPSWSSALELVIATACGLSIGLFTLNAGALRSFGLFLLALAALWFGAWQAYAAHRLLIDPMLPSMVTLWVFMTAGICRHLYSERRQRWVKAAFARYISPNRVEHLLAHPEALELGGRRQTCSFVFSDLADFTNLMESMDPGAAVSLLNRYLDEMIAIAFAHHGTLDRIVGDAVAIMFSAPLEQPDHQRRALQCALAMQRFTERYRKELNAQHIAFGQTRLGVHTGEVIVGNFGGNTIFDYRALGDPVNTASRLEGANKYLGTTVCVSEATWSGCRDIPARPIGRLRVKGKSIPLQVYEPLADDRAQHAPQPDYEAAYRLLRPADPEALPAFQRLNAAYPDDALVAFHLQRLQANRSDDLIELSEK